MFLFPFGSSSLLGCGTKKEKQLRHKPAGQVAMFVFLLERSTSLVWRNCKKKDKWLFGWFKSNHFQFEN
jgi:hypothetical protein